MTMHPCRDFAQQSILSLFSSAAAAADSRQGGTPSSASLVEFLDRKLGNITRIREESKKRKESKVRGFSLFPPSEHSEEEISPLRSNDRVIDALLSQRLSKKRHSERQNDVGNASLEPQASSEDWQCNDQQVGIPKNLQRSTGSLKRRKRRKGVQESPHGMQLGRNANRRLLVLGDDPVTRQRHWVQKTKLGDFNHYADGGGWWDTDMVGFDNTLDSAGEWEGVGTVSLGNSLGPGV